MITRYTRYSSRDEQRTQSTLMSVSMLPQSWKMMAQQCDRCSPTLVDPGARAKVTHLMGHVLQPHSHDHSAVQTDSDGTRPK